MSKRGVKVVSVDGESWTSIKAALRLVKRGMARYINEHTVQRIEGRQPVPAPSRLPAVVHSDPMIHDSGVSGFLRYPQRSGGNGQPYPALARAA
jgi:hypothetical protein